MSGKLLYGLLMGAVGITVGYLAQRSRMCFVAGLRDYILVRDRELLTGLFSFLLTVWLLTSVFYAVGLLDQRMPEYGDLPTGRSAGGIVPDAGRSRGVALVALLDARPDGLRELLGRFFWTSLGGGALIGFLSVLAGGCVLRQHVLCAQGNRNALFFVLGFYAAAVAVGLFLIDRLSWFYG